MSCIVSCDTFNWNCNLELREMPFNFLKGINKVSIYLSRQGMDVESCYIAQVSCLLSHSISPPQKVKYAIHNTVSQCYWNTTVYMDLI